MKRRLLPFFLSLLLAPTAAPGAESEPAVYPGLKELRLVADVDAIRPGETFTLGLWFRHEPGYHTYWKSPGIVGVPAVIDWRELPAGFEPGEIQWPAPQTTTMATLTAWGYETDTCLLIPMTVPGDLAGRPSITLKARVGWMCCAASCHPGWHDFSLTLPVADGDEPEVDEKWRTVIEASRERFPREAPEGWRFSAEEIDAETIRLQVETAGSTEAVDWSRVYFFADDNQVDSDASQEIRLLPGGRGVVLTFARPGFAPKQPEALSGVLYHPDGWPGLGGHRWMIASAPWPGYEGDQTDGQRSN